MKVTYKELQAQFKKVLLSLGFNEARASLCARIFAENSRDGVYSHGLNRFPVFVQMVKDGLVKPQAEPECLEQNGALERWDGNLAPGMYTATRAMERAIALAKQNGLGAVAVRNTNHWMRGGTYGWQAAEAGCVAICATNTIANMPPWGGTEARLGNNPLVLAAPRPDGHLVLDMAMSQFSYGKLQEHELNGTQLPVAGGYDTAVNLTHDPAAIRDSGRPVPVGFWKGAGLSLMIDVLVASLSGGRTVAQITGAGSEAGVSQLFLCINADNLDHGISEEIISYARSSQPEQAGTNIRYPGEGTLAKRQQNEQEGIPVNEEIWQQVLAL
ncbi:3-dehydro-L-gulonate 2-dehydrogenase [Pontibacter qinzhouensis]|uniref:3-dehydro-L-gulonate 2-dehydrogenase n=1 Tax=Pontibacter qinzhouensis TaxID=2603253 RepID=A0A5C8K0B9_9BACT|nr:3-dehydro-L-gulonate 2-dehydrogenase [Pontibacter qinzhouensis]TXK44140.1 3-dehydro-L-gulonate 2-dehydrogenase [Pontibacter qinzhouensis]